MITHLDKEVLTTERTNTQEFFNIIRCFSRSGLQNPNLLSSLLTGIDSLREISQTVDCEAHCAIQVAFMFLS